MLPIVSQHVRGNFAEFETRNQLVLARFKFGQTEAEGYLEKSGRWLRDPATRKNYPAICENCIYREDCESIDPASSPAFAWRQLSLIDESGIPTRRGIIFSLFSQGEGLAIAAALEQNEYLVDDLVFDLANLRAGHRFARDEAVFGGRLGYVCQLTYGRLDFPGYLEMGVPPAYGAGASEVIRDVIEQQVPRSKLLTDLLRPGDIERAITEWRSLLRQLVQAPDYPWSRWRELREVSAKFVSSTQSPTKQLLPALLPNQLRRYQPKASPFLSRVSDLDRHGV
ncbi:MAG: hypothetical protein JO076_09600 [Verrucomicrobia bacterium]|nr:hypothetical protein [Verrucomicrobiota bacterium]